MNGDWIELLKDAKGEQEYIIALNIDIRSFSKFCGTVESPDVADYIKIVYEKIMKDYFPDPTYSKPMGDGLFLIFQCEEAEITDKINVIVHSCISLVNNFGEFCKDEIMITFDVPENIGIGLARGRACCIKSGDKIIDYSGKILNHTARLTDKARPRGLICDYASVNNILKSELHELFSEDAICLRGISEVNPMKILYLKDNVIINERDRKSLKEPQWGALERKYFIKGLKKYEIVRFPLNKRPLNEKDIVLTLRFPSYTEGKLNEGISEVITYRIEDEELSYRVDGRTHIVILEISDFLKGYMSKQGLPDDAECLFNLQYPI